MSSRWTLWERQISSSATLSANLVLVAWSHHFSSSRSGETEPSESSQVESDEPTEYESYEYVYDIDMWAEAGGVEGGDGEEVEYE